GWLLPISPWMQLHEQTSHREVRRCLPGILPSRGPHASHFLRSVRCRDVPTLFPGSRTVSTPPRTRMPMFEWCVENDGAGREAYSASLASRRPSPVLLPLELRMRNSLRVRS